MNDTMREIDIQKLKLLELTHQYEAIARSLSFDGKAIKIEDIRMRENTVTKLKSMLTRIYNTNSYLNELRVTRMNEEGLEGEEE